MEPLSSLSLSTTLTKKKNNKFIVVDASWSLVICLIGSLGRRGGRRWDNKPTTIDPFTPNRNLHSTVATTFSLVPATRSRSDLDDENDDNVSVHNILVNGNLHLHRSSPLTNALALLSDTDRARKRQRTASTRTIDHPSSTTSTMRFTDSDQKSLSASPDFNALAGPSAEKSNGANGHSNGCTTKTTTNGTGNGVLPKNGNSNGKSIAKVTLPGITLYEDTPINREDESAATLEAESGYVMEETEVADFRQWILEGSWAHAEDALMRLGVAEDDGFWDAKFLISQQKYLELLEAKKTTLALHVLRHELAPLNVDADQLHTLSSYMMCSEPEDLRQRAGWDGAAGSSRRQLLTNLQRYIPSSVMIPERRLATLLKQAHLHQQQHCLYHNSPSESSSYSLYTDHHCNKSAFPRITTTILEVHSDEVWNMEWSHDGMQLATASKDKTAIIWRLSYDTDLRSQWTPHLVLKDHVYPVGCLSWSKDDSILLTSAENLIKLWNTKTGICTRTLDAHKETVTALVWLPDGSGFISGGLDRNIIHWDFDGNLRDKWGETGIRITDLTITPDFTRLVSVGIQHLPISIVNEGFTGREVQSGDAAAAGAAAARASENRMVIYDLRTKQIESSIRLDGELTSVKITRDSRFALVNHAPDEIQLWDLETGRLSRKFTGQRQGRHVIRSCFGGYDENFVVSGSEDGNVYIWHRDTGALIETLVGHGEGSVNSVAWNPSNHRMFASCSDDHTIRIWEAPLELMYEDYSSLPLPTHHENRNDASGKGKTRQQWDAEGVEI
ncbi:hypothetical protein H0H93_012272 [Arthromyces matolae]|nr:hypothetical protein H0H93_012272 [Arthromyces matolae]